MVGSSHGNEQAEKHLAPVLLLERVRVKGVKDAGAPRRLTGAFKLVYPLERSVALSSVQLLVLKKTNI